MGHSRQEYWSGQPFSSPGGLPDSGIDPRSTSLQVDSLPSESPVVGQSGVGSPVSVHLYPLPEGFLSASLLFFCLFQPALEPGFLVFFFEGGHPESI